MENPTTFQYDGTFDGLLSLVFYAFEHKVEPMEIHTKYAAQPGLFASHVEVTTNQVDAGRVWDGLVKKSSDANARMVYTAFLASDHQKEMVIWRYLQKIFTTPHNDFYTNILDEDIHTLVQLARKVKKEAHRFKGFVRFQQTADDLFFAPIDPDHDILWLIAAHFTSRYAGQKWVIYDTGRGYGLYYDLETLHEINLEDARVDMKSGKLEKGARSHVEDTYQKLWQQYYRSVTILERSNKEQMTRFMPRRYWKYLPEKDG